MRYGENRYSLEKQLITRSSNATGKASSTHGEEWGE
jgi:hypothetical protein